MSLLWRADQGIRAPVVHRGTKWTYQRHRRNPGQNHRQKHHKKHLKKHLKK